jgi:hypothetical protein
MSKHEAVVIIAGVFGVVLIYAILRYGKRLKAELSAFGGRLQLDGSAEQRNPGVRAHDVESSDGGITGVDRTGRGVDVSKAKAKQTIHLEANADPKDSPRH